VGCLCAKLAGPGMDVSSACIGQLWVFEHLGGEDRAAVAAAASRRRYQRGDTVFRQGEPARQMSLIKAGRVRLSKLMEDGTEITLDVRKAGDFLGEAMLIEEGDFPVSAGCLEESVICGFTRESFERLVLDHPNIGLQVIKNLSARIAWLTERIGSMSVSHLEDRLYRVLVNVAREHGVKDSRGIRIQFPLTHEDLSFLVGAHRVSITRALKSLAEAGRITRLGRTLYVSPMEGA
jgi:CRP/FNR family transcriptional regulator, cyclic AMP receptor protein